MGTKGPLILDLNTCQKIPKWIECCVKKQKIDSYQEIIRNPREKIYENEKQKEKGGWIIFNVFLHNRGIKFFACEIENSYFLNSRQNWEW